ncbi:MAG: cob(I)yrinic acid a,c-diamide adenosyltransferase [Myxococcota bacterium]
MKVYTRQGDGGETSLLGGRRTRKDARRIEAYGAVDELNALLGLVRADAQSPDLCERLGRIQAALFDVGGELASSDVEERERKGAPLARIDDAVVTELEHWIDALETELEPLRTFVLPGGARVAALLHHARTVCRRAERRVVSLAACESVAPRLVRYLNRLSDLLFVMARAENRRAGVVETPWVGRER